MWNWRACGDGPDQAAEFERPQFVLAVRAAVDRAQLRRVAATSHRCGSFTSGLYFATPSVSSTASGDTGAASVVWNSSRYGVNRNMRSRFRPVVSVTISKP